MPRLEMLACEGWAAWLYVRFRLVRGGCLDRLRSLQTPQRLRLPPRRVRGPVAVRRVAGAVLLRRSACGRLLGARQVEVGVGPSRCGGGGLQRAAGARRGAGRLAPMGAAPALRSP